ncbi:hypothetical protein Metin_0270 [Methanocaldococcus infernus ME]|uniref:Uncharacterized protein n=1 Tax=Methanocaldococcus infernus (strain DSM 11812 / JCM 15783 / ME) TaxID=573063 RepID=D5VQT7_METIM|nr:hypothetical protein [Methanocaldococcus infernus]ADG12940.1 hypothetical protein Metin_0270 [Methanocaldococcus infernus ME]
MFRGNVGIFYDSKYYYVVEFERDIEYMIGEFNRRNYLTHREKIRMICQHLNLEFPGYRGGEIITFGELPRPKKIYRVEFLGDNIEKIEETDIYAGELIYVTQPKLI